MAVLSQWATLTQESKENFALADLGGSVALLAALKRAALDEFSEATSQKGQSQEEDEPTTGASGVTGRSQRPLDVFRRFFLTVLRRFSPNDEKLNGSARCLLSSLKCVLYSQRLELAQLLKKEAVAQLAVGKHFHSSCSWLTDACRLWQDFELEGPLEIPRTCRIWLLAGRFAPYC